MPKGVVPLALLSIPLGLTEMGDEVAASLGVHSGAVRRRAVLLSVLLAGGAVVLVRRRRPAGVRAARPEGAAAGAPRRRRGRTTPGGPRSSAPVRVSPAGVKSFS